MYLDMLEEHLMPILGAESPDDMPLKQDGAPSHIHKEMTAFLNVRLPEKWIVRDYNLATSFS
jgi:hypothetical protein